MKTDGRVKYTQMMIKQAFLELLKSMPVEQASVTEICKLADINRATFYRHYENQYDLLSFLENEMFEDIKKSTFEYGNDIDKLTESILCKFFEKKETWLLLLSNHADLSFQYKIYKFFEKFFIKENPSKQSELKFNFLLYGYSGLITQWATDGMKETPVEMANYIKNIRHDIIK